MVERGGGRGGMNGEGGRGLLNRAGAGAIIE